jgi:hypothetical protein
MTPPKTDIDALRDRVQRLGFFGLLASWNEIAAEPWLPKCRGSHCAVIQRV